MNIYIKKFNELNTDELYEIMHLRSKIFVVEQDCPYLDLDYKDQNSIHIYMKDKEDIIAYLRIILNEDNISIGRILVKSSHRGNSISEDLLLKAIEYTFNNYDCKKIEMEAQVYLENFYERIGFKRTSKDYLLDNIPHFMMEINREEF